MGRVSTPPGLFTWNEFDGVDIIGLSSSGMPTFLFGMLLTNILTQMYKQWAQVVVAHRCDSGAGEEFGSRQANSGSHISACMLGHIGPVTSKYGIHTYRAFDGPDFDDEHVDQLPLITGYEEFAATFADDLADQLARNSPQQQPAEVALQQLEEHPPIDCELRHVLIELMLSPTQPLKQDDTAGNLPSSCEVVAYCHMGNTKLCIQRKGCQPHFIATVEHAAIPSSVRVSIGASLIYRLVLPPATTVYVALCTMQKMSYAFKTCQAHNLPDAFPPGSVGSTHLVHHRSCTPQQARRIAALDDVDAQEFGEYILTVIDDVLEYQRNQTEKMRNRMIDKAVRDSLESVVESVAVHVTAPDAAEALTTADAVVTGRVAYTQAPSVTAVPQSSHPLSPNHPPIIASKAPKRKRLKTVRKVKALDAAEALTTAVPQSPPKLPQENLHRSPLGCITNKRTRS